MKSYGLTALLCILIQVPVSAALLPSQVRTVESLRSEAARSGAASVAASPEDASRAAAGFDGKSSGLPVTVEVLSPIEYAPLPGSEGQGPVAAPRAPRPAPPAPGGDPARGPSYHFEGRRTAIPNLTIYTPVKDEEGSDGSTTKPPAGSDWKTTAVKALPFIGAAATVGGFFFPPLLFLGGLLLGAWGALKLLSRD